MLILRLFCCSLLPVTEYYDISLDKEPWKTLDIIMLGSEIGGADNPSSRASFFSSKQHMTIYQENVHSTKFQAWKASLKLGIGQLFVSYRGLSSDNRRVEF